jgi:hypothetical protein
LEELFRKCESIILLVGPYIQGTDGKLYRKLYTAVFSVTNSVMEAEALGIRAERLVSLVISEAQISASKLDIPIGVCLVFFQSLQVYVGLVTQARSIPQTFRSSLINNIIRDCTVSATNIVAG